MLKRSLLVLGLVGCLATFASAADYELVYNTGQANPLALAPDGPTTVAIDLLNKTGADFPVGGVVFDFDLTGASYDPDLGFAWAPWFDGSPHPVFQTPAYFPTVNPPQTALTLVDMFAVTVPAGGAVPVATLTITQMPAPAEDIVLVAGTGDILFGGEAMGFAAVPVDGAMVKFVPEPATLALLAIGGLTALRRRR